MAEENSVLSELLANPLESVNTSELPAVQQEELSKIEDQLQAPRVYDKLTEEEKKAAEQISQQIDISNSKATLEYGVAAQGKLSQFTSNALAKVHSSDLGEIGDTLTDLMFKLNETNPDELRGGNASIFKRMFGKIRQSIFEMTAKYQSMSAQIDTVAVKLEKQKNGLVEDNRNLDLLYKQNYDYYNALNVYIAAAELKLEELNTKILPEAIEKAKVSGDQMDAQKVQDLQQVANRLEKRNYDLKLSRQITIQQAPQIRLMQNTNQELAERIQTSINTSIPLWKNQVMIALSLLRQKDAAVAQRQVSETTNDLLTKNSEMLKISSIETAKENERGIVDIETLQKTQNDLIQTIEETLRIQKEGKEKRKLAEIELAQMENDLKNKLIEVAQQAQLEE